MCVLVPSQRRVRYFNGPIEVIKMRRNVRKNEKGLIQIDGEIAPTDAYIYFVLALI